MTLTFILLKYDIFSFSMLKTLHIEKFDYIRYEFSYKLKYKANSTEFFTSGYGKFYKLNNMKTIFEQEAKKLYPFYRGLIYYVHNSLNNQLYNELDLLKNELSHCTECSEVFIRIRVISG